MNCAPRLICHNFEPPSTGILAPLIQRAATRAVQAPSQSGCFRTYDFAYGTAAVRARSTLPAMSTGYPTHRRPAHRRAHHRDSRGSRLSDQLVLNSIMLTRRSIRRYAAADIPSVSAAVCLQSALHLVAQHPTHYIHLSNCLSMPNILPTSTRLPSLPDISWPMWLSIPIER